MRFSSSSLSSALLHFSLGCSGMVIWYAHFGLPLYHFCDCGCAFFAKHVLVKCPILLQVLHWYFFAGQLNPCVWWESPHLVNWFAFLPVLLLLLWLPLLLQLIPFVWVWFLTTIFLLGWQASVAVSQYVNLSTTLHV